MTANENQSTADEYDYDVVIVGGGPAGCSAGVFTGRYGLDTVIFDRGRSSLRRCAYLENYLGFPAGIDIDTLYELMHDHAEEAGCEIVPDLVEAVRQAETGYTVTTQEGRTVTAGQVVAAARYGGDFLKPLGDDEMFIQYEYEGEERERFNRDYPGEDGATPFDGLYVAAPVTGINAQAIISAGHGARVARTVIADYRHTQGYPEEIADHWDWMRREAELEGDRDDWREWFDERVPDDVALDDGERRDLREAAIDRRLSTYLSEADVEARTERGHERLAEHLDIDARTDSDGASDSDSDD
ncbi:thioredoxin reductase [Haloferax mucosum ATCC BAA-1512]|uniref:Thioredoxin reductase n=1 Tax=Haloferax mucosum ATCC BAA-1512 TaxID=662479 RepID=M0IQ49_9EURY|nr:NAD(P)/FAD-dependent oxidoreductase [Haloferax mucosum]ELZ98961.1 thioredoxin reductase [Haloferax mucosum ATCC BAA-1512]